MYSSAVLYWVLYGERTTVTNRDRADMNAKVTSATFYGVILGSIWGLALWLTSDINSRTLSFMNTGDPYFLMKVVMSVMTVVILALIISSVWWITWIERNVCQT